MSTTTIIAPPNSNTSELTVSWLRQFESPQGESFLQWLRHVSFFPGVESILKSVADESPPCGTMLCSLGPLPRRASAAQMLQGLVGTVTLGKDPGKILSLNGLDGLNTLGCCIAIAADPHQDRRSIMSGVLACIDQHCQAHSDETEQRATVFAFSCNNSDASLIDCGFHRVQFCRFLGLDGALYAKDYVPKPTPAA